MGAGPAERGKPRGATVGKPGKPKAGKASKAHARAKAEHRRAGRRSPALGRMRPILLGEIISPSAPAETVVTPAPAEPAAPSEPVDAPSSTFATPIVEAAAEAAAQVKVDPVVLEIVESGLKEDPAARVRVIVFGTGARAALERIGAESIEHVEIVDAESGLVLSDEVDVLAFDAGVNHVTLDAPVESTDDGSTEPATTATDSSATAATTTDGSSASTTTTASPTSSTPAPLPFPDLATLYPRVDGAVSAWEAGLTGKGIGIAVIDSGAVTAPEFGDRLVQVRLPGQNGPLEDTFGHGTFVASVTGGSRADGKYVGVAPASTVYAINVSRGDAVYTSDVINALNWVLANQKKANIRVVNLSLGETVPSSYKTSLLDKVVERVWFSGIMVVVSAGNRGADQAQYAPANDPYVLTVGATDLNGTLATGDDVVASWSTRGTTLDGHRKPELLAPGRHIVSLVPSPSTLELMAPEANQVEPGYIRMNGTSLSAPQASAAVAILLQQRPELTPDQVKWLLVETARPVTGSDAPALDIAAAIAHADAVSSANEGLSASSGPSASNDERKVEFNSSAAREALNWERAAKRLEDRSKWQQAAEAWEEAAESWEKVPSLKRAAEAWQRAAIAWEKVISWDRAAIAWDRAAIAWDKVISWDRSAIAWERSAIAWEKVISWDRSAIAWERSAIAWEKAISWDHAVISWDKAVIAWETAGRSDKKDAATWQKQTSWDRVISWDARTAGADKAAGWEKSSSFEGSGTWD